MYSSIRFQVQQMGPKRPISANLFDQPEYYIGSPHQKQM